MIPAAEPAGAFSAGGAGDAFHRGEERFALATGFLAQLLQIQLLRELLANYHGSELTYAMILGGGLLATALGCALPSLGGSAGSRVPSRKGMVGLAALAGPVAAACLVLARWLGGEDGAAGLAATGTMLGAVLLVVLPGTVLCGVLLGMLLRTGAEAARLYRAEAAGAILAGAGFTAFGAYAPPLALMLSAGAATAAWGWFVLRPRGWWTGAACLGGGALAIAALLLPLEEHTEALRWRSFAPAARLHSFADSPYGRIVTLASRDGTQFSLYQNGALCASLEPHRPDPALTQFADLVACLHPAPRRVLLVGDSAGVLPQLLVQRHGVSRVEALALDPVLRDVARTLTGTAPPEARGAVRELTADGRGFLWMAGAQQYDLILLCLPEPDHSGVNRFCTVEFFTAARRALLPDGILLLQLPAFGAEGGYTGGPLARRTAAVLAALREVFAQVQAIPAAGHLLAAAVAPHTLTFRPDELARRFAGRPAGLAPAHFVESAGLPASLTPAAYFRALAGGVLAERPALEGADDQPVLTAFSNGLARHPMPANSDQRPVAIAESLAAGRMVASRVVPDSAGTGDASDPLALGSLFLPAAAALLMGGWMLWRGRGKAAAQGGVPSRGRAALLFAAVAAGAFGMVTEIALLQAYQNLRGSVYSEIGLVCACFMAGLAAGTWCGAPWSMPQKARAQCGGVLLAMTVTALCAPALPAVLALLPERSAVLALLAATLGCGALTGAAYRCLVTAGGREGGWPGRLSAADLAGGAAGAVMGGLVWLPAFGGMLTMAGLAGALAGAFLLLWLSGRYAGVAPGFLPGSGERD